MWRTLSPDAPEVIRQAIIRARNAGLSGDYYEFGVYQGFTLWYAYDVIQNMRLPWRVWGFDSFKGLPSLEGVDRDSEFEEGMYACSLEEVQANLREREVDWKKLRLVPGDYECLLDDKLAGIRGMRPVTVAFIDCDLYHSTVPVLKFLGPLLQDKSILIFDDWNCFDADPQKGQRLAFRQWQAANPEWKALSWRAFGWHGYAFFMEKVL